VVVQVIITQFGGIVFRTAPLNGAQWGVSLGISFLTLPIGLILRLIPICYRPAPLPPRPQVTREKLLWENAIQNVRTQLLVVRTFRRGRERKQ